MTMKRNEGLSLNRSLNKKPTFFTHLRVQIEVIFIEKRQF